MRHILFSAAAVLVLVAGAAQATTITFSGLIGANGDPMPNPYTESGFDVTPSSGTWLEAHNFGNPTPDIYSPSSIGVVDVTEPGAGLFTFDSVDLADANQSGGTTYTL